jgi:RNA polymerase sigma-70 factor (ECF subfamily)
MASRAECPSDEEIVRRFQETGENACFAELFTRYRKRVFLACRGFFSEWQAAEDATQETFLRTYRSLRNFQGGDFSGWLMRVAKNVCIDEWRKRRLEAGTLDVELTELPIASRLDTSLDSRRLVERVGREMRSLAPAQRQCLELKIQGYSYEETAAQTGLSIDAVKSHLQNGRRMLWRRMEGFLGPLEMSVGAIKVDTRASENRQVFGTKSRASEHGERKL